MIVGGYKIKNKLKTNQVDVGFRFKNPYSERCGSLGSSLGKSLTGFAMIRYGFWV